MMDVSRCNWGIEMVNDIDVRNRNLKNKQEILVEIDT